MKYFFNVLLIILPITGFSQYAVGKTMPELRKELEKMAVNDKEPLSKISTTKSWISYTSKAKGRAAEFSFDFDNNGKCVIETIRALDSSAYEYYLKIALAKKEFEWIRINENQYMSKFSAYLMIELAGETIPNQFSFFKTDWSKEMYELLKESKKNK